MIQLYLLRHGETDDNRRHVLQGTLPTPLNEAGRQQAREAAARLQDVVFDAVVSSDLRRCVQTTETVLPLLHTSPRFASVLYTPLLRERDWGSATGKIADPYNPIRLPADMESLDALRTRARLFLDFVRKAYDGQTVLAVSHGFFCRIIQVVFHGVEIRDIPPMTNAEVRRLRL